MSVNSSASLNASHPFPLLSSNSSNYICFNSRNGAHISTAFAATNTLLLLPLSTLVLYEGFRRWRRQKSSSHTDLFTYHMVAMEIFSLMGIVFYCVGYYSRLPEVMTFGYFCFSVILPGQTLFHVLTCMERYLAVVHPVTYLGLRKRGGVRVRNISIGCVWLLCAGWMGVTDMFFPVVAVRPFFYLFIFSLLVSSFCSLSILCALTRPSPGESAGNKERVDQSKQRVLHTVVAIMGVLLLRFTGLLVCMVMYWYVMKAGGDVCVVLSSAFWFCLPSSVVLPLLFLHRAGKLAGCRRNTESVQGSQ